MTDTEQINLLVSITTELDKHLSRADTTAYLSACCFSNGLLLDAATLKEAFKEAVILIMQDRGAKDAMNRDY